MQSTDAPTAPQGSRCPGAPLDGDAQPLPREVLLLLNRSSRSGSRLGAGVLDVLLHAGLQVAVRECDSEEELRASILAGGDRRIVLGGGDGTVNCALPALVQAGRPFGLLPLGTANDLAHSLAIPVDPAAAMAVVAAGHVRHIDVALANDRYFVNAAHIGLATRVTRALSGDSKRRWRSLAYLRAALRIVHRRRTFRAMLRCDDATYHLHSIQITIGNGCRFGGGVIISEDAALDDGLLDFYNIPPKGVLGLAALAPYLRLGRHGRYDDIHSGKGRVIEIRTRRRMQVTTDGEITTTTPLRCEVCPRRLAVFAPPAGAS